VPGDGNIPRRQRVTELVPENGGTEDVVEQGKRGKDATAED